MLTHPLTHRSRRRRALLAGLAIATGALLPLAVSAQTADAWPSKPIQLVIPYPPGGSADLLGRPLAVQLQQQLGQPVVLEYKPGAGGTLATQYLARAKPDGYTVLMVLAAHAINDSLYPKLPYDTRKDFAPVSLVANLPMVVAGSSKLPARNIQELVQAAKAAPGQLTFGSAGNGNTGHLAAEYFSSLAGIRMTHVPYKGSAGVVNAMLAGDIDLTFDSISTSMPHIRSGRMHALAVTSTKRSSLAPELATVQEQGMTGFDVTGWYALIAPAGTPAEIRQRLSQEIGTALRQPQLQSQLAAGGYEPVGSTPDALQAHIDNEITRWAAVVKATGAKVD
ncbi:tripartite tricarboxylate transporter substrate binding protein [Oryzisolibacter sp. LB2S]|uniref:tripartite tricarboxylate transporter substrate binding protein n=1 Tax=Alicycliphilus soli TaxID=3228789 RepID=UPI003457BACD